MPGAAHRRVVVTFGWTRAIPIKRNGAHMDTGTSSPQAGPAPARDAIFTKRREAIVDIPSHLRAWIVEQRPELYTPMDHAAWRYILRVNAAYFATAAHEAYLEGLRRTGIGVERIPLIGEMDEKMRAIGWRAVAVSGFIPPQTFMEFQSLGILPIACDMRQLDHILYTPAPDVVHEAAGHAPIIADPHYSDYLRAYGQISRMAIYSSQDMAMYRAIRRLSEVKEDPAATPRQQEEAQLHLDATAAQVDWISEAAELSRMYWWTVEYGLVGSLEDPRIYGAGLLSSAGESWSCLAPQVRRIPLDESCVHQGYDITKPQPQLFVTPDFPHLMTVLERYAQGMAHRRGGLEALEKALKAKAPTTTRLDGGLQVGGVLQDLRLDAEGRPAFLRWGGPVLLSADDETLRGHDRDCHAHGFSMPMGPLEGRADGAASLSARDLHALGFGEGRTGRLAFASGLVLEGRLSEILEAEGRNRLIRFEDCRLTWGDELLFDPAWGHFDLACALVVESVCGGWADRQVDPQDLPAERPVMKSTLEEGKARLAELYGLVRRLRESGDRSSETCCQLEAVAEELERLFPQDWLLRLELVEFGNCLPPARHDALLAWLKRHAASGPESAQLVERGLALCD